MRNDRLRTLADRRFTLADAMVLIAATALGLALARGYWTEMTREARPINAGFDTPVWRGVRAVAIWAVGLSPMLAMWSLALLALRLRPPRPPLKRALRQPGFVATIAVAIGALMTLTFLCAYLYRYFQGDFQSYAEGVLLGIFGTGFGVAAAWAVLALSGRWRAEPHWIDRLGRTIGAAWLVLYPVWVLGIVL